VLPLVIGGVFAVVASAALAFVFIRLARQEERKKQNDLRPPP
jgi:hypothetical protein